MWTLKSLRTMIDLGLDGGMEDGASLNGENDHEARQGKIKSSAIKQGSKEKTFIW